MCDRVQLLHVSQSCEPSRQHLLTSHTGPPPLASHCTCLYMYPILPHTHSHLYQLRDTRAEQLLQQAVAQRRYRHTLTVAVRSCSHCSLADVPHCSSSMSADTTATCACIAAPTPGILRRHGCALPLHKQQIGALSVILIQILTFFSLHVPFLPHTHLQAIWIAIELALLLVGFPLYFWVELHDPAAAVIRKQQQHNGCVDGAAGGSLTDAARCPTCQLSQYTDSKHCNLCNKCSDGFDHHCMYLNTCIAASNYKQFCGLITCCK